MLRMGSAYSFLDQHRLHVSQAEVAKDSDSSVYWATILINSIFVTLAWALTIGISALLLIALAVKVLGPK